MSACHEAFKVFALPQSHSLGFAITSITSNSIDLLQASTVLNIVSLRWRPLDFAHIALKLSVKSRERQVRVDRYSCNSHYQASPNVKQFWIFQSQRSQRAFFDLGVGYTGVTSVSRHDAVISIAKLSSGPRFKTTGPI